MAMLISELLKEMAYPGRYRIVRERPFKYLALTDSEVNQSNCIYLEGEKYLERIKDRVTMVITGEELLPLFEGKPVGLCLVERPALLFFKLHNYLTGKASYARPRFKTTIGDNCKISPQSSLAGENVRIGDNVTIEEFVVIRGNTEIGDHSIIRAGSVIGGQGYQFRRKKGGEIARVVHAGGVKIGEQVEIQYNSCLDRAVFPWDNTVIGDYCKIGNLVQIAHGVKLGKGVMVVANATIGGRTVIGGESWVGLAATITNGITVGRGARVNMGAVVTKPVPDGGNVSGNFAIDHKQFLRNLKQSLSDDF
ncbi:MAG: UDP-3-O-(3-hydroxymyristoyl)glucosamine N-acyltransferase [Firmicutes bacterium]|nr:UDP-3-O-(3-hydroxymyristoyl)glucosamine N-acyltransferase [Bacillota bacterium]